MPKHVDIGVLTIEHNEKGEPIRSHGQRTMNASLVEKIAAQCQAENLTVAADALRSWLPDSGVSPDAAALPAEIEQLELLQQNATSQGDARKASYYEAAAFACRARAMQGV